MKSGAHRTVEALDPGNSTNIFTPEKRSEVMSKVRSGDTKPELFVGSMLHRMGYRFRLHRKDLPGKPDIVLPKYRTATFFHGCFWHQHPSCRKATSVVTALGAQWLPARVSPRTQLVAGLVGCAAGQLALVGLTSDSSIGRLLPRLLVAGAANGVLNAALGRQVVASVPPDRAAMGSGANNTARYVGSGITIVMVLLTRSDAAPGAAGLLSSWNVAALVTAGFSLLGALIVLLARERLAEPKPEPSGTAGPSRLRRAPRGFESIPATT